MDFRHESKAKTLSSAFWNYRISFTPCELHISAEDLANNQVLKQKKIYVSINQWRLSLIHQTRWLTQHVPVAAIICGLLHSESFIYLFYCRKWEFLPHASCFFSVCDQVRPTDCQYRDYKRSGDSFWSKLEAVKMDTAKLEHLFETKSKEMPVTKVHKQWLKRV